MTEATQGAPEGAPAGNPPVETNPPPQRPDNVPEKFWDAEKGTVNTEALLQSYVELEKTRGATQDPPQDPPQGDEGAPAGDPPAGEQPPAQTPYEAAVAKATEELNSEAGAISDETYEAFGKQGISREQIDTYVEGQRAQAELRKIHIEREVGGEEAYSAMLAWAGANYAEADAEAYNNAVFGADRNAAMAAARALKTKYEEAMGTDGKIVTNGTGAVTAGGYTSKDEWRADLRKPEYKKNAAFREEVRKKLTTAIQNGVDMGVAVRAG